MLFHIATGSAPSHSSIQFKVISFLTCFNMEKINKFHYEKSFKKIQQFMLLENAEITF